MPGLPAEVQWGRSLFAGVRKHVCLKRVCISLWLASQVQAAQKQYCWAALARLPICPLLALPICWCCCTCLLLLMLLLLVLLLRCRCHCCRRCRCCATAVACRCCCRWRALVMVELLIVVAAAARWCCYAKILTLLSQGCNPTPDCASQLCTCCAARSLSQALPLDPIADLIHVVILPQVRLLLCCCCCYVNRWHTHVCK